MAVPSVLILLLNVPHLLKVVNVVVVSEEIAVVVVAVAVSVAVAVLAVVLVEIAAVVVAVVVSVVVAVPAEDLVVLVVDSPVLVPLLIKKSVKFALLTISQLQNRFL